MSRVFITGSSAGLGLMAGGLLAEQGHQVVLHARDERRAADAKTAVPAAAEAVIGDASRLKDLQRMAEQLNGMGRFDAVIHNVGIGYREPRRVLTEDEIQPGWVPTRMGGPGAPDDINQAHFTQAWLAVSNEPAALVTGQYFYHMRPRQPNPQVYPRQFVLATTRADREHHCRRPRRRQE
jgi:NAD(P)-dependent dehydrogenase (short-subunit alcohol dehydrogenase family)